MKRLLSNLKTGLILLVAFGFLVATVVEAVKIDDLTDMGTIATGDLLIIEDVSETAVVDKTKKMTWGALMSMSRPIGTIYPDEGHFDAVTIGTSTAGGALNIRDQTTWTYFMTIHSSSGTTPYTADRTVTFNTVNADRTINLGGNLTVGSGHSLINQDVSLAGSPRFQTLHAVHGIITTLTLYGASPNLAALSISAGFIDDSTNAGITATNPGVQGNNVLTASVNEISVCGTADDAVTLPLAVAGRHIKIINNGAQQLEIWPNTDDDAGGGANTAITLAAGSNLYLVAYDGVTWEAF